MSTEEDNASRLFEDIIREAFTKARSADAHTNESNMFSIPTREERAQAIARHALEATRP